MTSENGYTQLSDVCEFISRGITPAYVDTDGVLVINQKCIRNGSVDLKQARRTDPQKKRITKEKYLKKFDILVNSTGVGTLGRVGQLFEIDGELTVDTHVTIVRPNINEVDPTYLGYVVKSLQSNIEALAEGSTGQTELSKHKLGALAFRTLNRRVQKEIGEICKNFDNRISILQENNATLEAIAQALFKSWFVDFDPVRAKSEGKLPEGIDEATAALFPDAFEETEFGMVPKGWRVLPFLDACDLQGGSQPPASVFIDEFQDGYVRLLQIRDFSTDTHTTYIPDTARLKKVTEDDVLIGRYGSASGDKAKDSLGRVCRGLSGAYNVALMKLNPLLVGREFAFQLVSDPRFYNYLQGVSSKAVQSGFSKGELAQYTITLPNSALIECYEKFGVEFWKTTKTNNERIKTLKTLRDTLLPRLISGQLHIADAEAELEKVTA